MLAVLFINALDADVFIIVWKEQPRNFGSHGGWGGRFAVFWNVCEVLGMYLSNSWTPVNCDASNTYRRDQCGMVQENEGTATQHGSRRLVFWVCLWDGATQSDTYQLASDSRFRETADRGNSWIFENFGKWNSFIKRTHWSRESPLFRRDISTHGRALGGQ